MARKITKKANVATQAVIMALILVVVNFLASRHFIRADFTAEREYTLAPASVALAESLDDIVTITAYFSSNLPPHLINLKSRVNDVLDEYRAYGGKNIKVRFIAPEGNPATEQKMRMMGIPQVQLNILDKDQFQATQVYMGIAIFYENRKEVIPFVYNTEDLEYQLTSALLKVTRETPIKVALASGGEAVDPRMGRRSRFSLIEDEIRKHYDYLSYSFGENQPIPADVNTLVVAGPENLDDADLYRLDQFVARGGKLVILVDSLDLVEGGLMARKVEHNLDRLFKAWGIEVKNEVVVDPRFNAPASFSGGFMSFRIPYPYWPNVAPQGFDKTQPIVSKLESLTMPWTSPVVILEPHPDQLEYTVLASSSPVSFSEGEPFNFNPRRQHDRADEERSPQSLAVLINGAFESMFEEGTIPEAIEEDEKTAFKETGRKTSVLIAGNSRFVKDDFLGQFDGNGLFFMNAVDWMAQSGDLIGIRSRGSTERPLPDLSEKAKAAIRFVNIFAVAGCVLLIGGIRWYLKRKVAARVV